MITSTTRILLLRHAETAAPDLFHGEESDVGLGRRGIEQAHSVGEKIAAVHPDAIYASGMRRAVDTAQIIADACRLPLQQSAELHERKMGAMSGQNRAEGWPVYEETKARWISGELDFTHPDGESFLDMKARAVPAFLKLVGHEIGKTVVVVAHGVINRILICSIVEGKTYADFDDVPIDFVGVLDLRWDGSTLRLVDYWPGEHAPIPRTSTSK